MKTERQHINDLLRFVASVTDRGMKGYTAYWDGYFTAMDQIRNRLTEIEQELKS